jgi:prepilin-type processing-associated H-X9-DG protein
LLADIPDPESTVIFYETAHPGDNPSGGPEDVVTPPRHNGGNNYGFADGGADWQTTKPTFGTQ